MHTHLNGNAVTTSHLKKPGIRLEQSPLTTEGADAHWIACDSSNNKCGQCSIWWRKTPIHLPNLTGFIGHFEAQDSATATMLLDRAIKELKSVGRTLVIGPMNGSSWHAYRATVWTESRPAFAMEPSIDNQLAGYFVDAGFNVHSRYISTEWSMDNARISKFDLFMGAIAAARFRVRNIDLNNFDDELDRIHRFCSRAFAENTLYTPIDKVAFRALYEPIKSAIRPEFVFIAEKAGEIVGLLFAIPDVMQKQRGERMDTLIFKTFAVVPSMRGRGLGLALIYHAYRAARAAGYRSIIHALMHRKNRSSDLSRRNQSTLIREYALFAKELNDESV